jgi:hypothetical protein
MASYRIKNQEQWQNKKHSSTASNQAGVSQPEEQEASASDSSSSNKKQTHKLNQIKPQGEEQKPRLVFN